MTSCANDLYKSSNYYSKLENNYQNKLELVGPHCPRHHTIFLTDHTTSPLLYYQGYYYTIIYYRSVANTLEDWVRVL